MVFYTSITQLVAIFTLTHQDMEETSPTSPTTVHVHRDGTIDITQKHTSTSPVPSSSSYSSKFSSSTYNNPIDDDEIAFEQSLQRLRVLANMATSTSPPVHQQQQQQRQQRRLFSPAPPVPTSLDLDQKSKERIDELDIELRSARAREASLRERLMSTSQNFERTERTERTNAKIVELEQFEEIKKLQRQSVE